MTTTMAWTAKIQTGPYSNTHPIAMQSYGWWSFEHASKLPESVCLYQKPDGTIVTVTMVCNNFRNPGIYSWTDAVCVGPVTRQV